MFTPSKAFYNRISSDFIETAVTDTISMNRVLFYSKRSNQYDIRPVSSAKLGPKRFGNLMLRFTQICNITNRIK